MILIDKRNDTQRVILTLGVEYDPILFIQNDENRSKHSLNLPGNTSGYPLRYDEFIFDTSDFDGLAVGYYTYQVFSGSELIECGKLKIIDEKIIDDIISAPDTQSFLIFK